MAKKVLSFDALYEYVREPAGLNNTGDLYRRLNPHGIQISRNKPIDKSKVDEICVLLTGDKYDWYGSKLKNRDSLQGGPLTRLTPETSNETLTAISSKIAALYEQLQIDEESAESTGDGFLAVACSGGYLRGPNELFSIRFDEGINVLIGERGSGKSTVLNLLGLVVPSVTEQSKFLLATVLEAISGEKSEPHRVSRRIFDTLTQYDIDTFVLFFRHKGQTCCLYADMKEHRAYGSFTRPGALWVVDRRRFSDVAPEVLYLRQGEVVRIGESNEGEQNILGPLLETFYPELQTRRAELAEKLKQFVAQYRDIKDLDDPDNEESQFTTPLDEEITEDAWSYIRQRQEELDEFFIVDDEGKLTEKSCNLIRHYLDGVEPWRRGLNNTPLVQLFEERAFDALYVGRIYGFLSDALAVLGDSEDGQYQSVAAADESEPTVQKVLDFLRTRLRVLRNWLQLYEKPAFEWYDELMPVAAEFSDMLRARIALFKLQAESCEALTKAVADHRIQVSLSGVDEVIDEDTKVLEILRSPNEARQQVIDATITSYPNELKELDGLYRNAIANLFETLRELTTTEKRDAGRKFIIQPMTVEYRQGNRWMQFQKLSFGQKSGIILNIVLSASKAKTVIIDQPEDHLDADAIAKILVPKLNAIGANRQLIIGSHSSALVMNLIDSKVDVLRSTGDFSALETSGEMLESKIVRWLLEILEGGIETFQARIKAFNDYVKYYKTRAPIPDMAIAVIEGFYRHRTIDELRNAIQPVVCDRDLVSTLQHELRGRMQSSAQQQIRRVTDLLGHEKDNGDSDCSLAELLGLMSESYPDVRADQRYGNLHEGLSNVDNVLGRLSQLCLQMDSNISALMNAINDIQMLDTHPNPEKYPIYDLLLELRERFLTEGAGTRRGVEFEVDPSLEGHEAYADQQHMKLVFWNLMSNAFGATAKQVRNLVSSRVGGSAAKSERFTERVSVRLDRVQKDRLELLFEDNGCGIHPSVRDDLYEQQCTTQTNKKVHGLGGMIIKKLLEVNKGDIEVDHTEQGKGTTQRIWLPIDETDVD